MGTVSFVIPPTHTSIVGLIEFKNELLLSGNTYDVVIEQLLDDASSWVETALGRSILRAQYVETLRGSGKTRLTLARRPIASIESVLYQGDAVPLSEIEVGNRDAGFLYRNTGASFGDEKDPNAWEVTYTAGWFVTDDNVSASLSVDATDDSYNSAGSLFPVHLKPGDIFRASGFTNSANNGTKKVVTATTAKITTASALVTEVAATRTLVFATLPGAIRRAVTIKARDDYFSRTHDSSSGPLIEESISGAITLRYAGSSRGEGSTGTYDAASALLRPYMDY